jgi:hypothetical protein
MPYTEAIRVGAKRIAAQAETFLISSFCSKLASVSLFISSFCAWFTSVAFTDRMSVRF